MKTLLLSIITILSILVNAQNPEIWGVTSFGGQYNAGTIFKTDINGNNHFVEHSMFKKDGSQPYGSPIQASNGRIYGFASGAGAYGQGVLFEYNVSTNDYIVKVNFDGEEKGGLPQGSLIQASNGKLYGLTSDGGINDKGVLFEYDLLANVFTKLIDFDGVNKGSYPEGTLFQASDGKLYGFAKEGGINNKGVLFEYDLSVNVFTKLIDFDGVNNGRYPYASLIQLSNEKLYGLTPGGGVNDLGVLFEFNISTNTITKLIDFDGENNGSYPNGNLFKSLDGKIYGLTAFGGLSNDGVLFEYDVLTNTIIKLIDFDDNNGSRPYGSLIQTENGKFYGLTVEGGSENFGVLFEYDATSNILTKKVDLGVEKGGRPAGSLIQSFDGVLYGLTNVGGIDGRGTLFEYNPSTNIFINRIEFFDAENGNRPYAGLIQTENGKLYGLTSKGGDFNKGVLFEYDALNNEYLKRIDFDGTNGNFPTGALMQASNGKYYGLTRNGGVFNGGVLFEYDSNTNTLTKKIDFEEASNYGSLPTGCLIQASNGKLYGVTYYDGINNNGVIFEYEISTNILVKKIQFDGVNKGSHPSGSLLEASNGKLYGLTKEGGENDLGVLFEYDPLTNTFAKIVDFQGVSNGSKPLGNLIQATNGNLYGSTYEGGTYNKGVMFEFNPSTNVLTKKINFNGAAKGHLPNGSVIQASNGKLYGLTLIGGAYDKGVLFEYDILTNTFTKKIDFDVTNGSSPSTLFELNICYSASIHSVDTTLCSGSSYIYADGTEHTNISSNETYISTFIGQAANGCDSIVTENVIIKEVAQQPSVISGPNPVCVNSNATYSVINVPDVTYYWDLPNNWSGSGNNSFIDVTTSNNGGTITLVPFNECGMGISRVFNASVTSALPVAEYSYTENQSEISFNNLSQDANSYYWNFGDGSISTIESPTHEYTVSGQYIASLIAYNICGEDTIEQLIDITVGIPNIENNNITIYPNPTNGKITIQGENIQSIKIINVRGNIIKQFTPSNKDIVVDISNEAKGIYFINIISQNEVIIKKIAHE